jgi:hypothetical protein
MNSYLLNVILAVICFAASDYFIINNKTSIITTVYQQAVYNLMILLIIYPTSLFDLYPMFNGMNLFIGLIYIISHILLLQSLKSPNWQIWRLIICFLL